MEEYVKMEVKGELGRGSFGVVYLVKHKDTDDQFAVKVIDLQGTTEDEVDDEKKEAELLCKLNHVNIVIFVTSYELHGALMIVTEYCAGGDLHTYLYKTSDDKLPEDLILAWAVQIARALEFLHRRNVLHRDLKPANVLLTASADARVADLGLARILDHAEMKADSIVGTPAYMSPECMRGVPYNRKTDIWSLGCVVFEMAERKKRSGHSFILVYLSFLKDRRGRIESMPEPVQMPSTSKELRELVYQMTNKDPKKRPDAKEFLTHRLVEEFIKKNETPAQVIKRCRAKPVDISIRHLRQSFHSIKPEHVRITQQDLKHFRARRDMDEVDAGSEDTVDAGSEDVTDGALLQPELRELGLDVIYRLLSGDRADVFESRKTEKLTTEEREDPAAVRQYYLKRFSEIRSEYTHVLSEDTVEAALDAIANMDDPDQASAKLAAVLEDKMAEYGQKLILLHMAELGCSELSSLP